MSQTSEGLTGATATLTYPRTHQGRTALRADVQKLLSCGHPHHFSVLLDWGQLVCSPMGARCIGRPGWESQDRPRTCHCDGPPHVYSPGWCPPEGPR